MKAKNIRAEKHVYISRCQTLCNAHIIIENATCDIPVLKVIYCKMSDKSKNKIRLIYEKQKHTVYKYYFDKTSLIHDIFYALDKKYTPDVGNKTLLITSNQFTLQSLAQMYTLYTPYTKDQNGIYFIHSKAEIHSFFHMDVVVFLDFEGTSMYYTDFTKYFFKSELYLLLAKGSLEEVMYVYLTAQRKSNQKNPIVPPTSMFSHDELQHILRVDACRMFEFTADTDDPYFWLKILPFDYADNNTLQTIAKNDIINESLHIADKEKNFLPNNITDFTPLILQNNKTDFIPLILPNSTTFIPQNNKSLLHSTDFTPLLLPNNKHLKIHILPNNMDLKHNEKLHILPNNIDLSETHNTHLTPLLLPNNMDNYCYVCLGTKMPLLPCGGMCNKRYHLICNKANITHCKPCFHSQTTCVFCLQTTTEEKIICGHHTCFRVSYLRPVVEN
jgi:hypothetical protein